MPCWWDVMLEQKKGSDPWSQAEFWNFTPGTQRGFVQLRGFTTPEVWGVLNALGTDDTICPHFPRFTAQEPAGLVPVGRG